MTKATEAKHDFKNGNFKLFDENKKLVYYEGSDGWWYKREFDENGNIIYQEKSDGWWSKRKYDENNKLVYYEISDGEIKGDL